MYEMGKKEHQLVSLGSEYGITAVLCVVRAVYVNVYKRDCVECRTVLSRNKTFLAHFGILRQAESQLTQNTK